MAFILLIDTATDTAAIGFAVNERLIAVLTSEDQKNHASFVQSAISQLTQSGTISLQNIDAVAVVNGPGSYTGLRVGLASAKGLCYALGKPLILVHTLEAMALATIELFPEKAILHCPLIDARRMEVFTGVYDSMLNAVFTPQPLILEADSFREFLYQQIVFSGNGAKKFQAITTNQNAIFTSEKYSLRQINKLAQNAFAIQQFADLAYCEPFYLKNFYILSR